ncbi:hypothetical protein ILUMI_15202 [Ignelater luminosus]|uniref:CCHC-type domain-containing protein n=1 Tax=Ignelater luminosus TaxID=2038154 RepID=A0A8K0G9R9_IGNLU|nr:hypothetical protein ILUMI_15202 [Ignelater luminosus]
MNGPSEFDRSEEVRETEGTENLNMMKLFADIMKTMENNRISTERMVLEVIKTKNDTEKFHIMPDLSKSIENYDGEIEKGPTAAKFWVEKLVSSATLHSWPPEFILESAKTHLIGAAKSWYNSKIPELNTLENLKDRFEKTFCMEASLTDKWNRMVKRIQRSGESLSIYFHDEYGLCKALNLNFPETKKQILVGLTNKFIVQGLLAKNHEDADQLLHDIVEFTRVNENVMRTTRKETTEKKIEGGKGVLSKAERTCYKCGETGHYKSECKNKEMKVCFRCKCKDHLAKHCPNKQKTGTVMTVNKIQRQEVVRQDSESEMLEGDVKNVKVKEVASKIENLYRPVMVNGVSLNGMVDNGSSMCIIKESVVRHEKWSIRLDKVKLYGYGCGGNPVKYKQSKGVSARGE